MAEVIKMLFKRKILNEIYKWQESLKIKKEL